MQQAALAVILAACGCAALGVQVVLRRMAFMGDAMAHATLPGVVMGFVLGWNLLLGALAAALASALGIAWASRHRRVSEDSAIGILYTSMFALGIIVLHQVGSFSDLAHILFGNPMGVTGAELWVIGIVTAIVMATLALMRRELALTLIDPEFARSQGVSPFLMRAMVLVLCAGTVVIAMRVVGVILTAALIITPAASARLICTSILTTSLTAIGIAIIGALAGMVVAYHWDLSMGSSIVLAISVIFIILRIATAASGLRS